MANRPLVLTVSADTSPLQRALDAGRTTLSQFGLSASASAADVEAAMSQLAASPANVARAMEQSFSSALRNMENAAQNAVSLGSKYNPLGGMTSDSADKAAVKLLELAQIERDRASAAATATTQDAQEAMALRVLATASTAAAVSFEEQAAAMKVQSNTLKLVEEAQVAAGTATKANQAAQAGLHGQTQTLNLGQMELAHVARSSADAFAAGIPVSRIAAMEFGRLSEAIMFYAQQSNNTTGIMGKMATMMAGPWSIALVLGIPILTMLVTQIMEAGHEIENATDKLHEQANQARITAAAHAIYDSTLDGLIDREKKLGDELERQLKTRQQLNHENVKTAGEQIVQSDRGVANARVAVGKAQKTVADLTAQRNTALQSDPESVAMVDLELASANKALASAQDQLKRALGAQTKATTDDTAARMVEAHDKNTTLSQKNGAQTYALNERKANNDKALQGGKITFDAWNAEDSKIAKAIAALGEKTTKPSASADNSLGQMTALLKQVMPGVRITSTTGGVHAKNSDHYSGHAIDFVPEGGMKAISYEDMKKALIDAGVNIRRNASGTLQFFGPGHGPGGANDHSHDNHFHVAWTGTPTPERAERMAEARQRKEDASTSAYKGESDRLDEQIAQSKKKHLDTIDEQYKADLAELDEQSKEAYDRIAKEAKEHGWSDAETQLLYYKELEVDAAKRDAVDRQHDDKLKKQALDNSRAAADAATQLLNIQMDMETTLSGRRAIQHQLLKIEQEQAIKALNADDSLSPEERGNRISGVNATYAAKNKQVDATGDAMQEYTKRLRGNVDDLGSALKQVEADDMQGLEDGFMSIIDGSERADVAVKKMVASMLQEFAKLALEKAIVGVLSFNSGGEVPGHAIGGLISGTGGSREDKIPARLSAGEFVVNASSTARYRGLLEAVNAGETIPGFADGGFIDTANVRPMAVPTARSMALGGGTSSQPIVFDCRGAVMTADLVAQMNAIAARNSAAVMIAAPEVARANMQANARQVIPT